MYNSEIQRPRKFISSFSFLEIYLLFIISFLVLCNANLKAQGNLLVFPHRVVFEGQSRSVDVNIANTGKDTIKYNLSFLQYRSTEDGNYETITSPDPGQNFADKNIRFYPRSVTLGPNESQVVKLQLTKKEQMEPGEYRSHLYFRAVPKPKVLEKVSSIKDTSGIAIKVVPLFGITIPVMIRIGASTTALNITDLKLEKSTDGTNKLLLTINRTGNMSTFGDISILHIAQNGTETKIGLLKEVAVYTPTALRRVQVVLENIPSVDLSKGTIHVLYSFQSDKRIEKLAEAELLL